MSKLRELKDKKQKDKLKNFFGNLNKATPFMNPTKIDGWVELFEAKKECLSNFNILKEQPLEWNYYARQGIKTLEVLATTNLIIRMINYPPKAIVGLWATITGSKSIPQSNDLSWGIIKYCGTQLGYNANNLPTLKLLIMVGYMHKFRNAAQDVLQTVNGQEEVKTLTAFLKAKCPQATNQDLLKVVLKENFKQLSPERQRQLCDQEKTIGLHAGITPPEDSDINAYIESSAKIAEQDGSIPFELNQDALKEVEQLITPVEGRGLSQ